ncbi:MerC mercury resistance protein [Pseudoxanthomonas wuyuanensis]|uniref:MerC mercury resistance protein n=2 Tax=Pseudoxanthomonas wuyuanensis TaxID=1073196 RepID=A0A286D7A6_9GAMM|nr:MerC mercury resistance protein [Pseudoxanthomonas wuyuanensis]
MAKQMKSRFRSLVDGFAATGSMICALHCALTPLLLAVIPSLGLSLWLGDGFERGFVVFVTVLGLFSLVWGYRRHRVFRALGMLLTGLAALWAGVLYAPLHESAVPHAVVMTLGGTLVGLAHLLNLRLNHWHVHDASCAH